MSKAGQHHPLVGSWTLRAWRTLDDDGREADAHPEATGLLTYAADGTMLTVIARTARDRFAADDMAGGTPDEQAAASRSFVAYGGAWRVDGDTVVHAVEHSLFPNWVGTEQRRTWALAPDDATLTLTSPPIAVGGVRRVQRLTWARVER